MSAQVLVGFVHRGAAWPASPPSAYALDHTTPPKVDDRKIDELKRQAWAPMVTFEENQYASTNPEVNPNYLLPRQGLFRLQKPDGRVRGRRVGRLHHQTKPPCCAAWS